MQINLSELFVCKGKEKTYTVDMDFTKFQTHGGEYEVTGKEPVVLRVQNVGERTLEAEGKAKLTLVIPCGSCLEPVAVPFDLELVQTLDLSLSEEDRIKDLDEQPYLSGYNLDVDQLVRNELFLNLPMKVLCREDCKGLCGRCGANLNQENCSCDPVPQSLGMSVIQDIFKQFKEV